MFNESLARWKNMKNSKKVLLGIITFNLLDNSDNASSSDDDIVSEEIKFNAQNGEGHYREVTYRDGGFRQFDVDTGELIGSSYDCDQDKLPSVE